MTLIKFAYVGEFTSRRRRVGLGEFARRRFDRYSSRFILLISSICRKAVASLERSRSEMEDPKLRYELFVVVRNHAGNFRFIHGRKWRKLKKSKLTRRD